MAASDNHLITLSGLDKFKECMGETIHVITSCSGTAGNTASGSYNRTQWTGTISGVTSLYDGLIIQYKVPIAGVSRGVTLNVGSLGEHPVVLNANTMATTHYPVGTQLILTYDSTATCSVYVNNVSTSFTGCWKLPEYDSNTTYSAGTAALLTEGTNTSNRVWPASVLASYVTGKIPANKPAASGGTTLSVVTTGEKYTWNNKSNLAIGTTASTAAAGNHTHTTSLATDSGTSTVNMAANTTYKLTAGGTSIIFKTPADNNTTYKLTIGSTTYGDSTNGVNLGSLTRGTATSGGTTLSLVNTGDMYTWNNKQNAITFNSTYNASTNKAATMTDVNTKATKADITAGTAGTSSATSGATLAVPYVTMSAEGVVTGYGTHTHTISGFVPSGANLSSYNAVSANQSAVTTSLTTDGVETKIYYNSGSSTITVSFATSGLIFTDGNDSMEIPAGGYGEVNFLRITTSNTTRVFVRSAVSE